MSTPTCSPSWSPDQTVSNETGQSVCSARILHCRSSLSAPPEAAAERTSAAERPAAAERAGERHARRARGEALAEAFRRPYRRRNDAARLLTMGLLPVRIGLLLNLPGILETLPCAVAGIDGAVLDLAGQGRDLAMLPLLLPTLAGLIVVMPLAGSVTIFDDKGIWPARQDYPWRCRARRVAEVAGLERRRLLRQMRELHQRHGLRRTCSFSADLA